MRVSTRVIALWRPPRDVEFGETTESEDPVRVAVAVTADEQSLTAVIDGSLEVVELRRGEG
jgi:hypothetical protein